MTNIGHYEIRGPLGKGGMGEVYRAFDTRLKREVALKLLPESLADDADRMARFQREAELLAALNHPNIAHVYGVEDRALVMELVDGESPKGPMPFDEAWKIALQIADALEYAHERGIIHRDLKPSNVKVTPDGVVKLLDFGLAKAFSETPESAASDPVNSPTITLGATAVGTIMGTAAYMAPEQAKGKRVDKRADIWSWGVVMYELITGDRMFKGDDAADTLAQVLTKEPDLSRVPLKIHKLVGRCLQKDPKQRLRDIGEARYFLEEGREREARPPVRPLSWVLAIAILIAVISASILFLRTQPPLRPMLRFTDDLGMDAPPTGIALSPDGTRLAFVGTDQRLYVRSLDNPKATMLAGTDAAIHPFFSPDGAWIGFFASGKVKKVALQGGSPIVLCDAVNMLGGSWTEDGHIIFTPTNRSGLMRIPDAGGTPEPLTNLDVSKGEMTHRYGQALPGGRAVLFTMGSPGNYEDAEIVAQILKTGERKTIYRGGYHGRYLGSGHLVYLHAGTMFAAPMDLKRLELTGPPAPVLDDVAGIPAGADALFDFSQSGLLAYVPGADSGSLSIAWLDSSGKMQRMSAPPKRYVLPLAISNDGTRLAVTIWDGPNLNLWIYDWRRDRLFPVTFVKGTVHGVSWAPDDKHLVFHSGAFGLSGPGIYWVRADGAGQPQRLLETANSVTSTALLPDGKRLAFYSSPGISILPLDLSDPENPKPGKPQPFLIQQDAQITQPAFSPDGRWIAYTSSESGISQVYVTSFPESRGKWLVSNGNSRDAVWAHNGHDLFYQQMPDGKITVVRYTAKNGSFDADPPRVWVDRRLPFATNALARDGRFAIALPAEEKTERPNSHVVFLLNFFDELRRRVPVK